MQMRMSCVLEICVDFNSAFFMSKLYTVSAQKAAFPTPTLLFSNEKVCKLKPFVLRFM